jgi:DNA replication licensing factor MCM4
VRPFNLKKLY